MKIQKKLIAIIMLALVVFICGSSDKVYASNVGVDISNSGASRYTATGAGNQTDHSAVKYYVDGEQAYCIQAGIPIRSSFTYAHQGQITDARFSWIIYNVADQDLKQAAIWHLAGLVGYGSYVINLDQAVLDVVNQATAAISAQTGAASASINIEGGNFTYDRSINAYVSPKIHLANTSGTSINGATGNTYFRDMNGNNVGTSVGSGTYQLVVPATSVSSDMDISITASSSATAQNYAFPDVFGDGDPTHQLVIKPRMETSVGGAAASPNMHLEALGDLKIAKKDEWGKAVQSATFLITGPHGYSNTIVTKADGTYELQGLRIGTYTITETNVGQNLYISGNSMNVEVTVQSGRVHTYNGVNYYKRGQAQLQKKDIYEGLDPKGDSILEGAVYELHAKTEIKEGSTTIFNEGETIITVKTDKNGKTPVVKNVYSTLLGVTLGGLPVGEYYWKEIQPSKGFNINPDEVDFSILNTTDLYTADQGVKSEEHTEVPIKGKVKVYKMDNDNNNDEDKNDTDKSSAAGAELRLTLISDPSEFYDVVIKEDGSAEFVDEDFKAKYPDKEFTIPYGKYEISETKASDSGEHTYYYIQPTEVDVNIEAETEQRILMDEPVPMYLKVIKIDKDSGEVVKIAGAKFKIWDCQNGCWVKQNVYPTHEETEVFETNDEGHFYTPQRLYPGKYIVYELEAPDGYYGDEEWRIPSNPADYGVEGKGGISFEIDKEGLGLTEDAEFPYGGVEVGALVYKIDIGNTPLKGKLKIEKKGEKLADATTLATEEGTKYVLNYENVGIENVVYEIKAAEDIVSPDGTYTYHKKDDFIQTITTDENGYAESKDLYLGKYTIQEISAPEEYVTDETIQTVVIDNPDKTVKVKTTIKELNNIRQKLSLAFRKDFKEVPYITEEGQEPWAIFGVYASQKLENYKGEEVVPQDGMLDIITVDGENNFVSSNIDLPAGTYYVKELKTSFPYTVSQDKNYVTLVHGGEEEHVTIELDGFVNDYDKATITLIKISTTSLGNVSLENGEINVENMDAKMEQILNDIKGMPEAEIRNYLKENKIAFVAGAEYSVFLDEKCEKPLLVKNEETGKYEPTKLVTDNTGLIKIEGLPVGQYYLKETFAPAGYELSEEIVEINLRNEEKNSTVYQILKNEDVTEDAIFKTSIFTGDPVPNCTFEIRDLDGNLAFTTTTNESGYAEIPIIKLENGKKYTFTEISAPDIYDLNTEPHEFTASYKIDTELNKIEWTAPLIEVENRVKTIDELIVRKIDEETGEPLQGCKFSIVLLDENGEPYVNQNGETIYLVKDAVTGENGEYVVENPYYGSYQFIEVEAPEGYEMKEDMNGLTFVIDENSPDTIIFEVTNTGDIAVIALAAVAVLSVVGIVFVIAKNRKKASKRA